MDFIRIDLDQFRIFFLVMIRCSVVLFFMPIFGSRNWPVLTKVGLVILLSLVLYPAAKGQAWALPALVADYGLVVITEALFALCLGLGINLILSAIQLGGQMVGFQLGFSIVNVIDPQSGGQVSVIGQFLYLMTVLLFLALNGHHLFIYSLADSITIIKPGQISLGPGLFSQVMRLTLLMFELSIKLVAPAVAVLLFAKTTMGVVAKAVPQLNVMIVSFPLNIGVGLFFVGISMLWIGRFMTEFVNRDLGGYLDQALKLLGGR